MQALEHTLRKSSPEEDLVEVEMQNAATRIQKAWRRRMRRKYLGPEFLWTDLAMHARMKVDRDAAEQGRNASRDRWKRGVFLAGRLHDGNAMLSQGKVSHGDAARKHLETQHWLELIDGKHRYGSNLKYYHEHWKHEDTTDNFFKWLDYGDGKELSLKDCPREQLERERITYLSPEQRLNYLVNIDNSGKLRWARNGLLVDTTAGRWKDAGDGKGIVPFSCPTDDEPVAPRASFSAPSPPSSLRSRSSPSLSGDEANAIMHYVGLQKQSKNPIKRILMRNFTLRGVLEKLLRKTIRRNTWIYVSDKNFNIFIGIKDPGTFQHSSFLAGGLVTSAGLISVKDGLIHTLSPLSGHYRTSIEHFRRFLSALDERGVDMEKVEISKAELALWGIEHLTKFKRKQAEIVKTTRKETIKAAKKVAGTVALKDQREGSSWKRDILEGRKSRYSKESEGQIDQAGGSGEKKTDENAGHILESCEDQPENKTEGNREGRDQ